MEEERATMSPTLTRSAWIVLALLLLGEAALPAGPAPAPGKLLEMSYPFDEQTIYWPTAEGFHRTPVAWSVNDRGWWYASNDYGASEHGGTHVDAPIHFAQGGRTIDQVPLAEWIGPAVKIDVTAQCSRDRDYRLTVEDIRKWEAAHGRIPRGAWVIMYTGVGTRAYPDPVRVLGTDRRGSEALPLLSFPGFSEEAARFLVTERDITGIALDTPSIDYGKSADFEVHRVICGANKLAIENLANLDKLPAAGAVLYAAPMMIRQGTGAPARVFAILP
jgi:kynurenine formamidase